MTSRFQVASRANVPPFHVMDLLAAAAERQRTHGDLLNLLAGQPMTGAPAPVREEAKRLLDSGDPLGYTPAAGHPRAARGDRRATTARRTGSTSTADEVVVTTGSQRRVPAGVPRGVRGRRPGGDGAARLPLLPQRADRARLRGGRDPDRPGDPVPADRRAARRSSATSRAWSSPARPTRPARCCCPSELAALAAWCEERGVQLISDEIYHGIEYARSTAQPPLARSAWETSREAVVFSLASRSTSR